MAPPRCVAVVCCCVACSAGEMVTLGTAPSPQLAEPEPEPEDVPPEPTMSANGGAPSEPSSSGGTMADAGAAGSPMGGTAGAAEPVSPEPIFGEVVVVEELVSDVEDENPTLTEDLLQIYFTSRREGGPGNADVWFAERAVPEDPFGEPLPLETVNTPEFDSSPAISPDGLTLWTAIDVEEGLGALDIWVSTRTSREDPWSELSNVRELNSEADDLPRPIGDGGRVMPIQSRRDDSNYQLYLATRDPENGTFDAPVLLDSLLSEGQVMGDGFITHDGLGVYFAYSTSGSGDLYFASRTSREADFANAVQLTTLNTDADERDPWLSPDGTRFYFASDRGEDGILDIYEARLISGS